MKEQTPFEILGLQEQFALPQEAIDAAWRRAIALVHPDRFAGKSAAEKRVAEQWASRINDAKVVLTDPVQRAQAILKAHGISLQLQSNTWMHPMFLERQFTWHEKAAAGENVEPEIQGAYRETVQKLSIVLDEKHDWKEAYERARELLFIEKIAQDLGIQLRNA